MHFNATNIHVLVNSQWLNDACSISWQQQGGVEPLWGYMDDRFRDVSRVTNLIVGTIGIYYRDHDKFFRYLAARGNPDKDARLEAQERAKAEVQAAIKAGTLTTLLASVPLDDPSWSLYAQAAMRRFQVKLEDDPDGLSKDADPVGKSGFDQTSRASATDGDKRYPGATLDVLLGDGKDRVSERLYGVWITGRARSPIENSPQTGAQPLMEYYSFIANHVGRVKNAVIERTTDTDTTGG